MKMTLLAVGLLFGISGCAVPGKVAVGVEWHVDLSAAAWAVQEPSEPPSLRYARPEHTPRRRPPLAWREVDSQSRAFFRRGNARGSAKVRAIVENSGARRRSTAIARANKSRRQSVNLVESALRLETEALRGEVNHRVISDAHARLHFEVAPGRTMRVIGVTRATTDMRKEDERADWSIPKDESEGLLVVSVDEHNQDLVTYSPFSYEKLRFEQKRLPGRVLEPVIQVALSGPVLRSGKGTFVLGPNIESESGEQFVVVTIQVPCDGQPLSGDIQFDLITSAEWDVDDPLFTASRTYDDQFHTWWRWHRAWTKKEQKAHARSMRRSFDVKTVFFREEKDGQIVECNKQVWEKLNGEIIRSKGWIANLLGL